MPVDNVDNGDDNDSSDEEQLELNSEQQASLYADRESRSGHLPVSK